jgi:hypothetical protein
MTYTKRDLVDLAVEYGMIPYAGRFYQDFNAKMQKALLKQIEKVIPADWISESEDRRYQWGDDPNVGWN